MSYPDKSALALEHADCLVRKEEFGVTEVHNICTNTVTEIPWALKDWVDVAGVSLLLAFFTVLIGGMCFAFYKMITEDF